MTDFSDEFAADPSLLARPEVRRLSPVTGAAADVRAEVALDANESAEADSVTPGAEGLNRYPEARPEALARACAAYAGVEPDRVLVTRGADEAIDLLVRAFCRPGEDAVLQFPPTYDTYARSAEANGAKVISLITAPDRGWMPDAAEAAHTLETRPEIRLVFACSPGSATGAAIPPGVLRKLAQVTAGRAIFVVDEALVEYSPADTAVGLLAEFPHVVILRTLSKAFALAGLRCGFVLGSPEVIGVLSRLLPPHAVPTPTAEVALRALAPESVARMRRRAVACVMRRCALEVALEDAPGVEAVFPSSANFLLAEFADARAVFEGLLARGIVTRDVSREPTLAQCLRITTGTEKENRRLLEAVAEIAAEAEK